MEIPPVIEDHQLDTAAALYATLIVDQNKFATPLELVAMGFMVGYYQGSWEPIEALKRKLEEARRGTPKRIIAKHFEVSVQTVYRQIEWASNQFYDAIKKREEDIAADMQERIPRIGISVNK